MTRSKARSKARSERATRGRALLGSAGLAVLAFIGTHGLLAGPVGRYRQADLEPEQPLPADVQAEVDATWSAFVEVFESRRRCFDDVRLLLVNEVEGGDARYDIDEARIEIEIPTSPARFRDSLAHELAHHLEHTCGAFRSLRADFAALPDVGPGPWSTASRWQDTPSELWAETVVELVIGRRVRHGRTMPLPAGATRLVEQWAGQGGA